VDATGHLEVGDGAGALTVDGTVSTRSVNQTVTLWSYQLIAANGYSSPHLAVSQYGQVRVSLANISSGPCDVQVSSSDSAYAGSLLNKTTLAVAPYSPEQTTTVLSVPGRTMWVASAGCQVEVEIYGRP
jgi:hypothetical protein